MEGLRAVRVAPEGLAGWDTSLVLFVLRVRAWCAERGLELDVDALPRGLRELLERIAEADAAEAVAVERPPFVARVGRTTLGLGRAFLDLVRFLGEVGLALIGLVRRPRRFRWAELLVHLRASGPSALPIVGLISLLVGVIVAFQAAIQLRDFGADIYVVNLVVLSVLREMGPVMTAVILAGRTGTAFAAQLGNMVVNEEVDALQTFGVSPAGFLSLPRILALTAMTPLLTLYADALGILGGVGIAQGVLGIPPQAFLDQAQKVAGPGDVAAGLVKSVVFGLLIALAGCFRGLRCQRTSTGIGEAATSAAVAGILLVIAADAIFGRILRDLGA